MRRSLPFLIVVLVSTVACYTAPRPVADPVPFLAEKRPDRIWLTASDGVTAEVLKPRVFADTLLGRNAQTGAVVWIGVDRIQELQVRELDLLRTSALLGAVGTGGILLILALGGDGEGDPNLDIGLADVLVPLFRRAR